MADGPLDELILLAGLRDIVPDLESISFFFGDADEPFVGLTTLDEYVDLVSRAYRGFAFLPVTELLDGYDALTLAADVDHDEIAVHRYDRA